MATMVGAWGNSGNPMVGYNYVSSGGLVLVVQTMINQWLLDGEGSPISEDGVYGTETWHAIEMWQSFQRIDVDGVVGPQTWGSFYRYLSETMNYGNKITYHGSMNGEGGMNFEMFTDNGDVWAFQYGSNWIYMDDTHYTYAY
jgi:hypothetical protein